MRVQGFLIYRIWYGDCLVYVGRTKQPLQSRIRGHLFSKPMHRTVNIEQVTKIEYAELGERSGYEPVRDLLHPAAPSAAERG